MPAQRRSWLTMLGMLALLVALAGGAVALSKETVSSLVILSAASVGKVTCPFQAFQSFPLSALFAPMVLSG